MATTEEIAQYYADLLILQYKEKAKAYATVEKTVQPMIMDQLPVAVQNAYSIETAIGVQLDVLGKYVGVSRSGYGLSGQPILLGDDDYRQLMKLVLIKNNSGSSLATIQSLLATNFPDQIRVSDNAQMQLNYLIIETLGTSDLLELLATGGYLPAPMAVQVSIVVVPAFDDPFFGFTSYAGSLGDVSPFNVYGFYQTTYPWLSYNT